MADYFPYQNVYLSLLLPSTKPDNTTLKCEIILVREFALIICIIFLYILISSFHKGGIISNSFRIRALRPGIYLLLFLKFDADKCITFRVKSVIVRDFASSEM